MTGSVGGIQALSVAFPISMEWKKQPRWPAFLLDILPQGHARVKLAQVLGSLLEIRTKLSYVTLSG
ncbi:hypothetical protein [Acidisphaera sp. S103]|uniref:hypothetical protein n=1 Tax=Acidisphaera sp. S103 TaxID=1747223 RepID=UPI00131D5F31|nr:hypothetical protein [Acidisphaera sp. S103]